MKEFMGSVSAFFEAVGNYMKSVWNGALRVLSVRTGEVENTLGGPMFAHDKGGETRHPEKKGFGWRVFNRRLERGRSGSHRPEWRGKSN